MLIFFSLAIVTLIVVTTTKLLPQRAQKPNANQFQEIAQVQYSEQCLSAEIAQRPAWECYEIITDLPEYSTVKITHTDGEQQQVITFKNQGQTQFRFTPTKQGTWSFSSGGSIDINATRPNYAKGFVASKDQKWIRTATQEAFVPQFIMYDQPDLDRGIQEFVNEHGFTGFHITNLRDFMDNPSYYETAILATYRNGGTTHFWIWGDKARRQTPKTYGVDVDKLYKEIAARLAPIPGWTVGYGFDLFEWASAREIEQFRQTLRDYSSYHHLVGGRGHKNEYKVISNKLDYVSWEWHQPDYQEYRKHLEKAQGQPAFSEDRFRIRTPTKYPKKDYNPELTRLGLWNSAIAGGVANIWGHQPKDQEFSEPYPNKNEIQTYSQFIQNHFTIGMKPDNSMIDSGHCLRDGNKQAICYAESVSTVTINSGKIDGVKQIIAVDTQKSYQEIPVKISGNQTAWSAPKQSDWAFIIAS
ncbi:MAG: hypothetical protein WA933_12285 [Microcoleaceae cyanobacterium]